MIKVLLVGTDLEFHFNVDISFSQTHDISRRFFELGSHAPFVFLNVFIKHFLRKKGLFGSGQGFLNG